MPTLLLIAAVALNPAKEVVANHANLTIYPFYESNSIPTGDYISLDDGLKQGTVIITEAGGTGGPPLIRNRPPNANVNNSNQRIQQQVQGQSRGATVNTLWLTNRSGKKLLILTGEIVSGGKQDRIIQKDTLVPSSKEPINVDVFCVEQNRWQASNNNYQFSAGGLGGGGGLADPSLRGKAQHDRSQSAVWSQVDSSLGKLKTENSTKTYQANLNSPKVKQSVDAYVIGIQRQFSMDKAVGVAVAVNGRMVWMDRFANNQLFRKYWPKMIKSYALEAMQAAERAPSPKPPTYDEAMRYAEARDGKMTHEAEDGVWKLIKIDGKSHVIYELEDLAAKQAIVVHASKMAK
ncbi:MAG: hypothetical protein H7Y17_16525 [Chlorobia bacterium]|nr:hypothetical protein [Fimbriimonadaceae bacterium]